MTLLEKALGIIMWSMVALMIIVFIAVIAIGHATYFRFLLDVDHELITASAQNLANKLSIHLA